MRTSFDISVEVSEPYDFDVRALDIISRNQWVNNQWPLVYFIQNPENKYAYVGESTNALSRIKNHLANPQKAGRFTKISIIASDKFNKSATLDIESNLIQYIAAEGSYTLQNGNYGLINHNYYQRDLYRYIFKEVWERLLKRRIVTKSLVEIENSELFKYSPYKSLNEDQYNSVLEMLNALTLQGISRVFIQGSAGTGKTILATYLMKLLHSDVLDSDENFNHEDLQEINYIRTFQLMYPKAKIGLVVAMTSLRESLKNVFSKIPGLKASMVISPTDTFKQQEKYDLLIVDEAHRLRQFKNISWMGVFRRNNQSLGLDDSGNELDWILANSKKQIFFYDPSQTIKPSDIIPEEYTRLLGDMNTMKLTLHSQMRVQGGNDYILFVNELLNVERGDKAKYSANEYELFVFDSLRELYTELGKREEKYQLSRLISGYSWPWKSKNNLEAVDIEIDGLSFKWNTTDKDWINSPTAFKEIGCIHTTQGYDLNYAGIIFGREIKFNKAQNKIEIDPNLYFDINGKKGITDLEYLKSYIINIYKTMMYRGIRGTFVYACDKALRDYLKQHIPLYKSLE